MKPEAYIAVCVQANIIPFGWAPPGCGKSTFGRAIATQLGMNFAFTAGGQAKDDDMYANFVPPSGDVLRRMPAEIFKLAVDDFIATGRQTLFLLDEYPEMPRMVAAAYQSALSERCVGTLDISKAIRFVLMGNRPEHSTTGNEISMANANRVCHFDFEPELEGYIEYKNSGRSQKGLRVPILPPGWEARISKWDALQGAFARKMPTLFTIFPPKEVSKGSMAWPSRRSWDYAAVCCAAAEAAGLGEDGCMALTAGCVGEDTAIAFFEWLRAQDLPEPGELLRKPELIKKYLGRADRQWAVLASVGAYVVEGIRGSKNQEDNERLWLAGCDVLNEAFSVSQDVVAHTATTIAAVKPLSIRAPGKLNKLFHFLAEAGIIKL